MMGIGDRERDTRWLEYLDNHRKEIPPRRPTGDAANRERGRVISRLYRDWRCSIGKPLSAADNKTQA